MTEQKSPDFLKNIVKFVRDHFLAWVFLSLVLAGIAAWLDIAPPDARSAFVNIVVTFFIVFSVFSLLFAVERVILAHFDPTSHKEEPHD